MICSIADSASSRQPPASRSATRRASSKPLSTAGSEGRHRDLGPALRRTRSRQHLGGGPAPERPRRHQLHGTVAHDSPGRRRAEGDQLPAERVPAPASEGGAGEMKMFLARRLWGLAQIADGLGMLFGLRFGLGLRVAKNIARIRARRLAADYFEETP